MTPTKSRRLASLPRLPTRLLAKFATPFSYRPSDPATHEIRVLVVSRTALGNISCTVRHMSLDSQPVPEYETISYYWGDPDPCSNIYLGGHLFPVPANTKLALHRMIVEHKSRVLWIDAVCINQDDLAEREQQVKLMGKDYSLSQRTLVYLGDPGAYTEM